ncbi:hypothetical protein [Convivina praedatoris]|uniref:IrrE N-terminal-like domain-containing protein n=1 Tax=Convivina praedatoris TaxID=2880963 RepID=A0ABM9D4D9_9LACO|nr:hypothetical protein [Convivina sp. LMG 32447]CAH1856231.1 hypothetical protein R077815_01355 [Convivina sp. LMG 32447]CAH1857131.1 hypothetical protein LMG032447_01454 [Convivina sp. LMG 32447]
MDTIIDEIIKQYDEYNVKLLTASSLDSDVPDIADLSTRQVVINKSSKYGNQLPFRMAHELMHIVNSEPYSSRMVAYHVYDVGNPEEHIANIEAIKLLLSLFGESHHEFNWLHFMNDCGIPSYLEDDVKKYVQLTDRH